MVGHDLGLFGRISNKGKFTIKRETSGRYLPLVFIERVFRTNLKQRV
jgi:hypothetical protein